MAPEREGSARPRRGGLKPHRRQVFPSGLPSPPCAGRSSLGAGRKPIAIEPSPDPAGWGIRKWISPHEPEDRSVAREESLDQQHEPTLGVSGRKCGEPHEPVEPEVIRRDLGWPPPRVAWLAPKLILGPGGPFGELLGTGALEDDLVALAGYAAERPVSIHQMVTVEAVVHQLAGPDQIADRPVAEGDDDQRQSDDG